MERRAFLQVLKIVRMTQCVHAWKINLNLVLKNLKSFVADLKKVKSPSVLQKTLTSTFFRPKRGEGCQKIFLEIVKTNECFHQGKEVKCRSFFSEKVMVKSAVLKGRLRVHLCHHKMVSIVRALCPLLRGTLIVEVLFHHHQATSRTQKAISCLPQGVLMVGDLLLHRHQVVTLWHRLTAEVLCPLHPHLLHLRQARFFRIRGPSSQTPFRQLNLLSANKNQMAKENTPFTGRVLSIVSKIKKGKVLTYKEVAIRAGSPGADRAVGTVLSHNWNSVIPCHRVIKANGSLGGYNRGAEEKEKILRKEGY